MMQYLPIADTVSASRAPNDANDREGTARFTADVMSAGATTIEVGDDGILVAFGARGNRAAKGRARRVKWAHWLVISNDGNGEAATSVMDDEKFSTTYRPQGA